MNNQPPEQFDRVVAYIRKSSEDNEKGEASKQLNSIDYQRKFVGEAQRQHKLTLVHPPFEDDKTGYEAFVRDGFEEMLTYLKDHKKEVDGIICTEISRLARNFADGGMILWYMQSNIIKRIYTPTKIFTNSSSDQLMVAIEFAMSKKSSDDTGYRTIEGMKSKAFTMKHPSRPAILGYKTEGPDGAKKWIIDEVNGPLVKRVFEQFATGNYTFDQITDFAHEIGLRSKLSNSKTSKISPNTWRNRLKDEQYIGIFYQSGERVAGEYEPLIDTTVFYHVQEIIMGNEHPKDTHIEYAYSKMVKCGLCGDMFSGTNKKGITYYRCAKRKLPCKDMDRITYVPETKLEENLIKEFSKIEIDQEAWEESREYVAELNQPQKLDLKKDIRILNEKVDAEDKIQLGLGRKYSVGDIPKSEYDRLLKDSQQKQAVLRNTIVKCENIVHELDELMNQFLDNIKHVTKRLESSLPKNKRELVDIFCENLVWNDGKARWDWKKPYFFLVKQPKNSTMLPLIDMFRKREIEIDISLTNIKTLYETFNLSL